MGGVSEKKERTRGDQLLFRPWSEMGMRGKILRLDPLAKTGRIKVIVYDG